MKPVFSTIWPMVAIKIWSKEQNQISDTVLRDKAFKIASDPRYDGYERALASIVYKFVDKTSAGSGDMSSQQLAHKLHKPII